MQGCTCVEEASGDEGGAIQQRCCLFPSFPDRLSPLDDLPGSQHNCQAGRQAEARGWAAVVLVWFQTLQTRGMVCRVIQACASCRNVKVTMNDGADVATSTGNDSSTLRCNSFTLSNDALRAELIIHLRHRGIPTSCFDAL